MEQQRQHTVIKDSINTAILTIESLKEAALQEGYVFNPQPFTELLNSTELNEIKQFNEEIKKHLASQAGETKETVNLMQNLVTTLHDLTQLYGTNSYEVSKQIFQKILPQKSRTDICNALNGQKFASVNEVAAQQQVNQEENKAQLAANGINVQDLVVDSDWSGYFSGAQAQVLDITQLSLASQEGGAEDQKADNFKAFIDANNPIQNLYNLKMGLEEYENKSQDVNQKSNAYDDQLTDAIAIAEDASVVLPCFIGNHYFAIGLFKKYYSIIDRSPHLASHLKTIEGKMAFKGLTRVTVNPKTLLKQESNNFTNVDKDGNISKTSNACIRYQALNSLLWQKRVETDDRAFILDEFPDFIDLCERNSLDIYNESIFKSIQACVETLATSDKTVEDKNKFRENVIKVQMDALQFFVSEKEGFLVNEHGKDNKVQTPSGKTNDEQVTEILRKNIEQVKSMITELEGMKPNLQIDELQSQHQYQSIQNNEEEVKEVVQSNFSKTQENYIVDSNEDEDDIFERDSSSSFESEFNNLPSKYLYSEARSSMFPKMHQNEYDEYESYDIAGLQKLINSDECDLEAKIGDEDNSHETDTEEIIEEEIYAERDDKINAEMTQEQLFNNMFAISKADEHRVKCDKYDDELIGHQDSVVEGTAPSPNNQESRLEVNQSSQAKSLDGNLTSKLDIVKNYTLWMGKNHPQVLNALKPGIEVLLNEKQITLLYDTEKKQFYTQDDKSQTYYKEEDLSQIIEPSNIQLYVTDDNTLNTLLADNGESFTKFTKEFDEMEKQQQTIELFKELPFDSNLNTDNISNNAIVGRIESQDTSAKSRNENRLQKSQSPQSSQLSFNN